MTILDELMPQESELLVNRGYLYAVKKTDKYPFN